MNDLQIVVNQQQGVIITNFEDIKQELSAQMEVYKDLEVTEANKPERKKDVATLRKMIKAVSDKRIEVKRECLKPYDAFEKLSNELVEIINEPIGIINNQVMEFEDAQRIAKAEAINEVFDELIGVCSPEMQDEIGLITIYDTRWENASATLKSVKDEMIVKLNAIRDNVALISSMVSDKTEEALKLFWGDLDITKAMGMITRYEAQKKEIADRMIEQQRKDKELEEERQRLSREREVEWIKEKAFKEGRAEILKEEQAKLEIEHIKAEAERRAREDEEAKTRAKEQAELEALAIKKQSANLVNYIYGVSATEEEIGQVEMYMNSLGVNFERMG